MSELEKVKGSFRVTNEATVSSPVSSQTAMQYVIERLYDLAHTSSTIKERLEVSVERLDGFGPVTDEKKDNSVPTPGYLGNLHTIINAISENLSVSASVLDRMESIL